MRNELRVVCAFFVTMCLIVVSAFAVDSKKDTPALEVTIADDTSAKLKLDVTFDEMESIGAYLGCDIDVTYGDSGHFTAVFSDDNHGVGYYGAGIMYNSSSGGISMGMRGGDLVKETGLAAGDTIVLYVVGDDPFYNLVPNYRAGSTDKRADYDDDQKFGNYRELIGANLKEGTFYRSSNPWNYTSERAEYSDKYFRSLDVENLICFDLSMDEVKVRCEKLPDAYATSVYEQGRVHAKKLTSDIHSDPTQTRFVLESLMDTEGSVGVFCTYGKDRTGAYCAMIEGLAGATFGEIRQDYMESFCNYYHIDKGSTEYEALAHMYIDRVLYIFQHPEFADHYLNVDWSGMDFTGYDPEKVMTEYLVDFVGLSPEFVGSVKEMITT